MRIPHRSVLLACALAASGCDDAPGTSEDFATEGLSQTLTLRFEAGDEGALTLRSSGKALACATRFDGIAGERITCERTGERVEVLVAASGDRVVAVRDLARKRGTYTCSRSGDVEGAPATMKCKLTPIRPRGSGGLSSPFDASVEGVSVPNTHWVDAGQLLLRGMEPRTPAQLDELRVVGVERVLIFKNTTGHDDVGEEIAAWGLPEGDTLHVPFAWKDLPGFTEPCEQTVEALRFLRASVDAGRPVFFHCTVGEDRTGYLAALHGVLFEGVDPRDAFDVSMCERGYASGNPQKPGFVLGKLEDGLTPLYRSMAWLVDEGVLTEELDLAACAQEPVVPDDFLADELVCGTSTTLVP